MVICALLSLIDSNTNSFNQPVASMKRPYLNLNTSRSKYFTIFIWYKRQIVYLGCPKIWFSSKKMCSLSMSMNVRSKYSFLISWYEPVAMRFSRFTENNNHVRCTVRILQLLFLFKSYARTLSVVFPFSIASLVRLAGIFAVVILTGRLVIMHRA